MGKSLVVLLLVIYEFLVVDLRRLGEIFPQMTIGKVCLLILIVSCLAYSSALNLMVICFSETSGFSEIQGVARQRTVLFTNNLRSLDKIRERVSQPYETRRINGLCRIIYSHVME
jgi:hypothetical protein